MKLSREGVAFPVIKSLVAVIVLPSAKFYSAFLIAIDAKKKKKKFVGIGLRHIAIDKDDGSQQHPHPLLLWKIINQSNVGRYVTWFWCGSCSCLNFGASGCSGSSPVSAIKNIFVASNSQAIGRWKDYCRMFSPSAVVVCTARPETWGQDELSGSGWSATVSAGDTLRPGTSGTGTGTLLSFSYSLINKQRLTLFLSSHACSGPWTSWFSSPATL